MKEKDFQTNFTKYLKGRHKQSGAFELKITHEKSLPFSAVLPHQEQALYAAKHACIAHKIADDSIGFKPFDTFMQCDTPAFVVVMFYRRGQKEFFMIDIDDWLREKESSQRRSLTEERARQIGAACSLA